MLDSLDAAAARRWCALGLDALRRHQREIDEMNVYPVPDGDTGTNLLLTLTSAWQALASREPVAGAAGQAPPEPAPPGDALALMARGALLGARGNSGVIVSQILRGLAEALHGATTVDGPTLAHALHRAATAAYAAVAEPVEGTILTVMAASAEAASRAAGDLASVTRAAALGAAEALARTPEQLPVLARAGVVDAGGRGLVVLLDALVQVVTGEAGPAVPMPPPGPRALVAAPVAAVRESGSEAYAYEVQYLLDATEGAVGRLRAVLAGLGDSLVIVGSGEGDRSGGDDRDGVRTWNVHVHVNDIGAAIEAGVEAGRPRRISVTRFADAAPAVRTADTRSAVVVAPGRGLADLFAAEGATAVGARPSTAEVLEAVRATGAGHVVVLPNDPDSHAVARAAAEEAAGEGIVVRVVPTRCPVQALAALAVRDRARPFEDDVIAMAEAAGACRYAEVTVAGREALTLAGRCEPGDILALVEGEVNLIGKDLVQTCRDLLDRLLATGGELVTLVIGADGPDGLADALTGHLARAWPYVEVHVYVGGQPHYPLLVGVE